MNDKQPSDEIFLRVPARVPYDRIVRVGTAALALRRGLSAQQIEDLGTAVDAAMALLIEPVENDQTDDSVIECVFRLQEGGLELEAARSMDRPVSPEEVSRFSRRVGPLVNDYDLDETSKRIRLRKLARTQF